LKKVRRIPKLVRREVYEKELLLSQRVGKHVGESQPEATRSE